MLSEISNKILNAQYSIRNSCPTKTGEEEAPKIESAEKSADGSFGITDEIVSVPDSCVSENVEIHKPELLMREKYAKLHEGMEVVHVGTEVAEALGATGALAGLATLGTAASGIYFGIEGAKDLRKAIKDKNAIEGIEAGAHIALAGESALKLASEAAHIGAISGALGPTITAALTSLIAMVIGESLGFVHGAAEAIVGGKEIYDGIKEKDKKKIITGALEAGIGMAVAAIAVGGGPIAGISLAGIFLTKMLLNTNAGEKVLTMLKNNRPTGQE